MLSKPVPQRTSPRRRQAAQLGSSANLNAHPPTCSLKRPSRLEKQSVGADAHSATGPAVPLGARDGLPKAFGVEDAEEHALPTSRFRSGNFKQGSRSTDCLGGVRALIRHSGLPRHLQIQEGVSRPSALSVRTKLLKLLQNLGWTEKPPTLSVETRRNFSESEVCDSDVPDFSFQIHQAPWPPFRHKPTRILLLQ